MNSGSIVDGASVASSLFLSLQAENYQFYQRMIIYSFSYRTRMNAFTACARDGPMAGKSCPRPSDGTMPVTYSSVVFRYESSAASLRRR